MNVSIFFYLLLCVSELFSSSYNFDFKKVEKIPSEITCYDYSKLNHSKGLNDNKLLNDLESSGIKGYRMFHCFDMKHSTGVCILQHHNYCEVAFTDGNGACVPLKNNFNQGLRGIGVSKNIIVCLTLKTSFYMIEVPSQNFSLMGKRSYATYKTETPQKINFNSKEIDDLILSYLSQSNETLYCFPGNEGEFYFTFDHINKTEPYLLTIKSKRFFTPTKILLCSGFAIGILLFIFKNFIKAKLLNNF